jgi:hypothetical protein
MALDYVWEKLYAAVSILATGDSTIQDRLGSAYGDSLIRLTVDDLPEEIRGNFIELEKALTRENDKGDEGLIAATMTIMSPTEAASHAETIISMFDKVAKMDPMNEYHTKVGRATL